MDSVTQIVLGAAVGEAVLGKKVGNKAMLYGAIAGTIPDLDTFARFFVDTVTALEIHRGFTHSIIFSIAFAPLFGWLISRWEKKVGWRQWSWLFFFGFLTHPLLDAHTTWGTQLFWPFDLRLAYKNIFVVDPIYTLPFLLFLILAMRRKRDDAKRRRFNNLGIIISSSYLLVTLLLKGITYYKFQSALEDQGISYARLDTRPSPFNCILWTANVEQENNYLVAYYSLFDSQPIKYYKQDKNHELLGDLVEDDKVRRLVEITQDWYTVRRAGDLIELNDVRFGKLSVDPNAANYTFTFQLKKVGNEVTIIEKPREQTDMKKSLSGLWNRIKGN